jgi:predicted acylesterase/phospholipase RssA
MSSIEYLVIGGGGPNGLGQLGILEVLHKVKFLNMKNIKKIFSSSCGAILGGCLALGLDITEMVQYMIERPWNKLVKIDLDSFLSLNQSKGLISSHLIKDAVMPFFKAYDIDVNITLEEVYKRSGIELNIMTVDIGLFKDVCLNYRSFPDLPLLTAVAMSAAMPPIFSPVEYEGKYYLDGGLLNNYPLNNLTSLLKPSQYNKILAIKIDKKNKTTSPPVDIGSLSVVEYASYILQKSFGILGNGVEYGNSHEIRLPYEVTCEVDYFIAEPILWKEFNKSIEAKRKIYNNGVVSAHKFLDKINWAIKPTEELDNAAEELDNAAEELDNAAEELDNAAEELDNAAEE